MALVIETGTGSDAGANSYANRDALVAYAAARNITLPATGEEQDALLLKAMDYLEVQSYSGERVSRGQALSWPRVGAYADGWAIGRDEIPAELKQAQVLLAVEAMTTELLPASIPSAKGAVIEETVEGAVSVKYASPSPGTINRPSFPRVDALLSKLTRARRLWAVR